MKKIVLAVLISLFISTPLLAQKQTFIAVLDLTIDQNITSSLKIPLSLALAENILKSGQFRVLDRKNIDTILKEQGFQLSDCTSSECIVRVGQLLGVTKIVTGNVSKVGDLFVISVMMTNVETGEVETMESSRCRCDDEQLFDQIRLIAEKLSGVSIPQENITPRQEPSQPLPQKTTGQIPSSTGSLYIESDPSDAQIIIDGKELDAKTPSLLEKVFIGEHKLILKNNNSKGEVKIIVVANKRATIKVKLDQELKANLKIDSNPSGANIYINGKYIGITPKQFIDITPGQYKIRIVKESKNNEEIIILKGDESKILKITLLSVGAIKKDRYSIGINGGASIPIHVWGGYTYGTSFKTNIQPGYYITNKLLVGLDMDFNFSVTIDYYHHSASFYRLSPFINYSFLNSRIFPSFIFGIGYMLARVDTENSSEGEYGNFFSLFGGPAIGFHITNNLDATVQTIFSYIEKGATSINIDRNATFTIYPGIRYSF